MNAELLARLRQITEEEKAILAGADTVDRGRYTSRKDFVIDSAKLLEKGKLSRYAPTPGSSTSRGTGTTTSS